MFVRSASELVCSFALQKGCLDSVEWNGGLEWWTGMVEWNGLMEWWNGEWYTVMVEWNRGTYGTAEDRVEHELSVIIAM